MRLSQDVWTTCCSSKAPSGHSRGWKVLPEKLIHECNSLCPLYQRANFMLALISWQGRAELKAATRMQDK